MAKKIKLTYFVQKTEEIEVEDFPEGAQLQSIEIDGKTIPLRGNENLAGLAQVLSGLGMNAIKIGGNEIPLQAVLQLVNLIPGLIEKLGIELK